jgi:hypothetical protein
MRSCRRLGWLGRSSRGGGWRDSRELVERIKGELSKLGPILDLEVVRDPQGSTNEGAVTRGAERSSTVGARGLEARRTRRKPLPATLSAPTRPGHGQGGGLAALGKPERLRIPLARADARTSTLWASIRIKSFPS